MWSSLRAGLEPDLAQHPLDDSEAAPDRQQEKMLRSAASDYIDRIVDGRGLRQRVITQPRPNPEVERPSLLQRGVAILVRESMIGFSRNGSLPGGELLARADELIELMALFLRSAE